MWWLFMAPLPRDEHEVLVARVSRAFRRALAMHGLTEKEAAYTMGLDPSQLTRMLAGRENFPLVRVMRLGSDVFGDCVASLLDECGGWSEVLAHGLSVLIEPLVASRGCARMARAALSESQRERISA